MTCGSTAIMCTACRRGAVTAGPDGLRDPVPNNVSTSKAVAAIGFSGSSAATPWRRRRWRRSGRSRRYSSAPRQRGAFVDRSLARLARLAFKRDEETDDHAWVSTRSLARKENLSSYDAGYLELAIGRPMSLASCDQALLAAAAHVQRGRGVMVCNTPARFVTPRTEPVALPKAYRRASRSVGSTQASIALIHRQAGLDG